MKNLILIFVFAIASIKLSAQTTGLKISQLPVLTSPAGAYAPVIKSGVNYQLAIDSIKTACLIGFTDITGNPVDNSALVNSLNTKQDALPIQGLLDIKSYFINGQHALINFNDATRSAFNAKYDSTKSFVWFSDSSNVMLSKGAIPNTDSLYQVSGWYRYSTATRGRKPTNGSGMVLVLVAQDLKFTNGVGRVTQIFSDYNLNTLVFRSRNDTTWTNFDTLATISYVSSQVSSGAYLPITGGSLLGNTAQITFPRQTPALTFPANNDIQIGNTNGHRFYIADSLFSGSSIQFDKSLVSGNKVITWDNLAGHPTLLGNTFNGALQLVQLNSSGYFPALDGRNIFNIIPSVGLSVTGGAVGQSIRINPAGTAFEFYTPSTSTGGNVLGTQYIASLNSQTIAASTTQYGYFTSSGNPSTLITRMMGVGEAGTLDNFWLFTSGTQSATGALTATVYKNNNPTALTITIAAGSTATSYSDLTHSVSVAAGDILTIQYANAATAASLTLVNSSITFKQ